MSDNCLICGASIKSGKFGNYCSKDCRDSELAVLGKIIDCKHCGKKFKSVEKTAYCSDCAEFAVKEIHINIDSAMKLSPFEYSIFEDNLERVFKASDCGDKRNCLHAVYQLSKTLDTSSTINLLKAFEESNESAVIWLMEMLTGLRDKRVIKPIERYLLVSKDETVRLKAKEAIMTIKSHS